MGVREVDVVLGTVVEVTDVVDVDEIVVLVKVVVVRELVVVLDTVLEITDVVVVNVDVDVVHQSWWTK